MTKKSLAPTGCGTALITPFKSDGEVDWEAFRRLVDRQLEAGIHFLVPCGTTGEAVTLSDKEYSQVIQTCARIAGGRVAVVAGAGSNSTRRAIELGELAQAAGADLLLSVGPYYNKPTQEGFYRHFSRIAEAAKIPVIIYNVPGRTGSNIEAATQLRLAREAGIAGVKEASGNLSQIMTVLRDRPQGFRVLSGDDNLTLALLALGADGLISVASNVIPAEMSRLVELGLKGELEAARSIHYRHLELMNLNFIESNPIPVKYVLSSLELIEEVYRLPLCQAQENSRRRLDQEIDNLGLR